MVLPTSSLGQKLNEPIEELENEIFGKSSHHVNTNKGSVVTQSGNDVEACRSQKVLFQPNLRVFLQYSVRLRFPILVIKVQLQRFHKLSLFDRFRHVENGFDINF